MKTKIVKTVFFIHQYEQEEEFLRSKRLQGWKFINYTKGLPPKYEFVACEPENFSYQLDYIENEKDSEDYHQLFLDDGC